MIMRTLQHVSNVCITSGHEMRLSQSQDVHTAKLKHVKETQSCLVWFLFVDTLGTLLHYHRKGYQFAIEHFLPY